MIVKFLVFLAYAGTVIPRHVVLIYFWSQIAKLVSTSLDISTSTSKLSFGYSGRWSTTVQNTDPPQEGNFDATRFKLLNCRNVKLTRYWLETLSFLCQANIYTEGLDALG